MWWFTYIALVVNLLIIWFMPKRLTRSEIYVTWLIIACINLSADIILALYFKLYELDGKGIQLGVHFLELTLSPSYGIIYLNFMPRTVKNFIWYLIGWVSISVLFEYVLIHFRFINYSGWELWYSALFYPIPFLFLRWHLDFIRKNANQLK
jgi:hypothetical protein